MKILCARAGSEILQQGTALVVAFAQHKDYNDEKQTSDWMK
mgnify:CR=1 FL=1|jgi:hypothetical protein